MSTKAPRLARYTGTDISPALSAYLGNLLGQIERAITETPSGRTYTVTNPVTQRALNVSTAAAGDVAQVIGTLIGDLKEAGMIA